MARIRTIKPEFFHDEDVAALPLVDRLVYIGLWTVADKAGRLEDRPRRLKALLLPYDDADLNAILARLIDAHFVLRYAVDGGRYLQIRTWDKHQRPHHTEPESTYPPPPPPVPPTLEGVGKGRGREVTFDKSKVASPSEDGAETVVAPLSDGVSAPARSKADAFAAAWNEVTSLPIGRCRELTPRRRTAIAARLRERTLEDWREVFARIQASAFCRGDNERGWHADIDFVLQPDTAAKVLEGKYDDRPSRAVVAGPPVAVSQETWAEARQRQLAALRGAS